GLEHFQFTNLQLRRVKLFAVARAFALQSWGMIKVPAEHPRLFSDEAEGISFEEAQRSRGFKAIAGVDEVGRGPLAGPVVAAAVILPPGYAHPEIKDSKLLTAKQRE